MTSTHRSASIGNAWAVVGASLVAVVVLVLLLWRTGEPAKPGDELVLYCATGMTKPVEEICQDYEREFGVKVILEADASGKLLNTKVRVAQNRGDLFLSADQTYIERAQADGLVLESIPVARIHPVIVIPPGNPKKIAAVHDLLRADVKVALANPEQASIGRVTKEALGPTGEWAQLEKQMQQFQAKVSLVGTVNEVAQAVTIGAADAGIVWDITARGFKLPFVEAPQFQNAEERVTLGVLTRSDYPQRALHFARYVTARDKGLPAFAKYHFQPMPQADRWAETPTVDIMTGAMLRPAIEATLQEFQQREGVRINWICNGCGILVAQMKSGKVPAAYFACDTAFMEQVQHEFLAPVELSENDMVILVQKGNPLGIRTLADMTRPGLRLGLGHPEQSALGKLTHRILEQQGLKEKLLLTDNLKVESPSGDILISQILAGALDAVVVYRSNARANPENLVSRFDLIEIDLPGAHAVQPFAIARNSDHHFLMQRLLAALKAPTSRQRFQDLGFRWLEPQESR